MLHTQQRNYSVSLLRKAKIRYYTDLNEKKIQHNNSFGTYFTNQLVERK